MENKDSKQEFTQTDVVRSFSYEEVYKIALDVMNLGMSLRQDQLTGRTDKSGNEVVSDYMQQFKITNK